MLEVCTNEDQDKNNQVDPASLARVRAFATADLLSLLLLVDFAFFFVFLVRTEKVVSVFAPAMTEVASF